ncbi:MAG: 4-hydroxy-tetrahydrodipicolinate reductase [Microscillaceae bacterium]|nr:4-hydroxy-tetrahydrodipicolinate reductase [Microscillaceae bacterium]
MRISLIGYGKMGKTIEQIALQRQHQVVYKIDRENQQDLFRLTPQNTDVAIEFTQPDTAFENLKACLEQGVPVLSGTTGWLHHRPALEALCEEKNGAFFYASNFSIGVNLFFQLNQLLARLMARQPDYHIQIEETHHLAKKDQPSGTALTLAEGILQYRPDLQGWQEEPTTAAHLLPVLSFREGEVPGTHTIQYISENDTIEIKHTAHNRRGFATGAVLAAEWLLGKKGIFGMEDFLKLS